MKFKVGDVIVNARTGQRRIVARITPAGSAGTRVSDGPTYHAAFVAEDGSAKVGGHVADIWSGSMSSPLNDWELES